METRLQAAKRYGVLRNAQGDVGDLAARKGKGLASSASARVRARRMHGMATTAANDERHTGFMCAACAQFKGSVLG